MYWAKVEITNHLDRKSLGEYVVFHYTKLKKDQYLVVLPTMLRRDPIKQRFAVVTEKKFRKLTKDKILQKQL